MYVYIYMYIYKIYTYTYPSNFVNTFENESNRSICVWGEVKHRFCVSNQLVWIRERNYPLSRTKEREICIYIHIE